MNRRNCTRRARKKGEASEGKRFEAGLNGKEKIKKRKKEETRPK